MIRDKKYYMSLEYDISIRELTIDEGGGVLAYYFDMPFIAGDGEIISEAIEDAKSAFSCYLDVALEKGDEIKEPSHLTKIKRVNISIPEHKLIQIDTYAKEHNMNRSSFLVESALKQMSI